MTKKRASPVRTSEGKPNGFRRIKGAGKANGERRSKAAKSGPAHEGQAELPYQSVEAMPARETETNFITVTDKREVRNGDAPREEPQASLRLDVGAMSLEDAGFGLQDGEEEPRKHMRVLFDFHLSGQLAQQFAYTGLPYYVQLMAWDLVSGQATVLATDQSNLTSGLVTYPALLQFPLPELGRYRLVGLILLPDIDKVGVTLGDILNVLP